MCITLLTHTFSGRSLSRMSEQRPIFFGKSTSQMASLAREAMEDAVADAAKAGISVCGLHQGRIQHLPPSDPLIQAVIRRSEQRNHQGPDSSKYLQRGISAITRTVASDDGIPAQEVITKLESKLVQARKSVP